MRRHGLVLLLILAVLAAGCTSPAADVAPLDTNETLGEGVTLVSRANASAAQGGPGTSPDPNAAASPVVVLPPPPRRVPFGLPVELPLVGNIGAGEPNIAALPDGTLFVTSPTGIQMKPNALEGAAYLWRSQDGGATWETLRSPDPGPVGIGPFCSCDADVIGTSDGTTYFSDWWDGNYMIETSTDSGETWASNPFLTREAAPFTRVDRQWLVAGENGFVALFYAYFTPVTLGVPLPVSDASSGIHAVFSNDFGATWGDPVVVVPDGDVQIAHPRMLPDGTLVMPYGGMPGGWRDASTVMLAVSTDQGASWEHIQVAEAPEGFDNLWAVQADVDATGAIHVGWAARVDDDIMATYLSTSRDAGRTWTEPLALRAEGLNFLPWVAATGNGTVAMGWYGGDATGDPVEADAPWYAYVAESRDGGETFAVHKVSDEPVKVGPLCPRGAACGSDRELLDYVSMVYDAAGNLHYAFARSEDGVAITMVATALAEVDA